jgi:hypothetical protein
MDNEPGSSQDRLISSADLSRRLRPAPRQMSQIRAAQPGVYQLLWVIDEASNRYLVLESAVKLQESSHPCTVRGPRYGYRL